MTIGELVFRYACVFFVLLIALVVSLLRQRAGKKVFAPAAELRALFVGLKDKAPRPEFWLKTFLAAFTALAAGLIIVFLILPYGSMFALGALLVIGAALVLCMPRLLA
jgi:hypothetical protein